MAMDQTHRVHGISHVHCSLQERAEKWTEAQHVVAVDGKVGDNSHSKVTGDIPIFGEVKVNGNMVERGWNDSGMEMHRNGLNIWKEGVLWLKMIPHMAMLGGTAPSSRVFVCLCACGVMQSDCPFIGRSMLSYSLFGNTWYPTLRDSHHGHLPSRALLFGAQV